jgi:tRNA(Ile)-lysidine synthetase-like protein
MANTLKYIVAVSGGVDSAVLLDKLARQHKADLVVAHFDHGIRPDSAKDREFVKQLAKNYGLAFEYAEGKLGPDSSEAKARAARYKFLNKVKSKYRADAIVTAHHQDDIIETAIINILRGTKRKGLSSLSSQPGLLRPLLDDTKFTIVKYATGHKLSWREDPTNQDTKYLRNYVRLVLIPKLDRADSNWRAKFLAQLQQGSQLNRKIEPMLDDLTSQLIGKTNTGQSIRRSVLIGLPSEIGRELVKQLLINNEADLNINEQLIKRAWLFAKTGRSGASFVLSKDLTMKLEGDNVLVTTKTSR